MKFESYRNVFKIFLLWDKQINKEKVKCNPKIVKNYILIIVKCFKKVLSALHDRKPKFSGIILSLYIVSNIFYTTNLI